MSVSSTRIAAPSNELYQAFIRNSSEGVWRFEIAQPVDITLPAREQLALFFEHAYLGEANDATAKMYGFDSAEPMIGMKLDEFMSPDDPENIAYLTAFVETNYALSGVESHEKDNEGRDKYFRNSMVGIIENGRIVRAWGTQQDITKEREAIEALKHSEERLTLALESSSMGLWEWDIKNGKLFWSSELKKLYGLSPNTHVTFDKYLEMIHKSDRTFVLQNIEKYRKTGEMYQFEHRIVHADGSIHWMLSKGRSYLVKGVPVRMIGTSTNIDEVKRATELANANALLKKQRLQLLAINKTKDEFIALASHQLRTPATAVKQYTSLLLSEFAGPLNADQEQLLQVAYDSNERQLRIINDLLKTAQIDSSSYSLHKSKQRISDLIKDCAEELEDLFRERHQTLTFVSLTDDTFSMDASEMKHVIINLLENASKYSHPNTSIEVAMRHTNSHVEIAITDHGVGIDKPDQKRIFEKFTRVNNDLSDTVSGTGFGLYWVKRIIALHGGTIRVKSAKNQGSTFTIRLPL